MNLLWANFSIFFCYGINKNLKKSKIGSTRFLKNNVYDILLRKRLTYSLNYLRSTWRHQNLTIEELVYSFVTYLLFHYPYDVTYLNESDYKVAIMKIIKFEKKRAKYSRNQLEVMVNYDISKNLSSSTYWRNWCSPAIKMIRTTSETL